MKINHHLDESTLVSYVAGSLSQGMALVVATHISLCEKCREGISEIEAIGGALLEQMDSSEISDTSLETILSKLDEEPIAEPEKGLTDEPDGLVPPPLRSYIGKSLDSINWRRLAPGFACFDIFTEGAGVCRLLKVSPGKSILPHGHHGSELTLLLRGAYSDEIGRFAQGDIADLDDQVEHQPLVDEDQGCICLVATDSPLRFTTLLGKLLQPVSGF